MKLELLPKHTLLLEGPVKIKVIDGTCSIFGARISKGESFLIPSNKSVALFAETSLSLDIETQSGSQLREVARSTIPKSWIGLANYLSSKTNQKKPFVTMFIGDVDKGKTTLITLVANTLADMGKSVAIIDADIGQSDIGPPTTIGIGILEKGKKILYLSQLECKKAFFVGSTSPVGILDRSITGVKTLTDYARTLNVDAVLIDTTGWVADKNARELKITKVFAVNPDLVVLLQRHNELTHIARAISSIAKVKTVTPSPVIKRRSREKRKRIRESLYLKYLKDGQNISLSFDSVSFGYSFLGTGEPITDAKSRTKIAQILNIYTDEIIYAEESYDALVVITKSYIAIRSDQITQLSRYFDKREIRVASVNNLNGIIVGLLGRNQEFLSIGVLQGINFKDRVISIYTTANASDVECILFGSIRIENHGEEVGWIGHWFI